MNPAHDKALLPGQELIEQGLADLSQDRLTDAALAVWVVLVSSEPSPLSFQPWLFRTVRVTLRH
jgi:hypothetical protein